LCTHITHDSFYELLKNENIINITRGSTKQFSGRVFNIHLNTNDIFSYFITRCLITNMNNINDFYEIMINASKFTNSEYSNGIICKFCGMCDTIQDENPYSCYFLKLKITVIWINQLQILRLLMLINLQNYTLYM
jgi:hypothetical protein